MKKKSASKKKTAPVKKKAGAKRKSAPRRKSAAKKAAPKRKASRRPVHKRAVKKTATARKKPAAKKARPAKKRGARRVAAPRKKAVPRSRPYLEEDQETTSADFDLMDPPTERGLGLESGGQSGDTEGLSRSEIAASESVEELLEEGQAFEAGIISGVENAPDADEGGVRTRQVPEDDVPEEYIDRD